MKRPELSPVESRRRSGSHEEVTRWPAVPTVASFREMGWGTDTTPFCCGDVQGGFCRRVGREVGDEVSVLRG